MSNLQQIKSIKEQVEITTKILRKRLETILPLALREAEIDMWLIICQEDNLDPIYKTMIPIDTWPKVLQILIFTDLGQKKGIERINLSMTDTKDLYDKPWRGGDHPEQWQFLANIIKERDPKKIGINIGNINWASGGLTYNLYNQLVEILPTKYIKRLTSAEKACTKWGSTLTDEELQLYTQVSSIARKIIAKCFSAESIIPSVTTIKDLEWLFWQICIDNGIVEQSFKPYFTITRSNSELEKHPLSDRIIHEGDLLTCDVGIKYLGLYTDHQELAYVRYKNETDVPEGLKNLLALNNRLQYIFIREFKHGLSGNQLFENILTTAKKNGITHFMIFSHSLGIFVHEPGPVIGLPWNQSPTEGRGDIKLDYNSCFAMELNVKDTIPEWNNQQVYCQTEHIVKFTKNGCELIDDVQKEFHLI
ncbi:MAG: M24 family metallopeptidase [Candidatus Heimdallarchaeota archaeon]|nr:M24 family metallopeptidase [Candidatus Heimdallarchaeota archaeon]